MTDVTTTGKQQKEAAQAFGVRLDRLHTDVTRVALVRVHPHCRPWGLLRRKPSVGKAASSTGSGMEGMSPAPEFSFNAQYAGRF
jgi:hypothetical protein